MDNSRRSPLSAAVLESHLWEAADILSGPVDAADFKSYVLPLLFFKRLLDVEGIAHVVTLDVIAANDQNLNIPRYVEPKITQDVLTVDEAMKRLYESAEAAFAAEDKLVGILKQAGFLV